jgi:hypothetical protein
MNQEGELLEQEGERCFCDAIEAIWIQAGEQPSFKLGQKVLSRDGNWFAAKRVVGVLRKRSAQIRDGYNTNKQLAEAIWALVKGKLSFEVLDSRIDDNGCIKILPPFAFVSPSPPMAPTPLNRATLNKPEHIFWVKVGLALRVMNKFLAGAIHTSAKEFHTALLAEMGSCGIAQDFNGGMTLYKPENAGTAALWAAAIKVHHMGSQVNWSNSNATMWGAAEGGFEVMKLFCASMGKNNEAIKKTSASDVDFSSLTAMLLWCDHFKADSDDAEKKRKGLIRAASAARNPWAHNAALEFTKEESDRHLEALCTLLEKEPLLRTLPEARVTLDNVRQIRDRGLSMEQVGEEEMRGIEQQRKMMTRMDEVSRQIQGVSEQVAVVDEGLASLAESSSAGQAALSADNRENYRVQAKVAEERAAAETRIAHVYSEAAGGASSSGANGHGIGAVGGGGEFGSGIEGGTASGAGAGTGARAEVGVEAQGGEMSTDGGIVAAMCSYIPRIAAGVAEVPGGNRLKGENEALRQAHARVLWPASAEGMVDSIKECNPSVVHIAGHNQYLEGGPRLVGFSEGDDGLGFTELSPTQLAQLVVGAATLGARRRKAKCALVCVLINSCNSLKFAEALLAHAEGLKSFSNQLRVIYWPNVTDDIVCWQFAKGFYEFFEDHDGNDDERISDCYESGMLQIATKQIKLTPALVRGDLNHDVTYIEPPQLMDAHTKAGGMEESTATVGGQEVERQRRLQQARGAFVLVQASESGREHFKHLHDTLEAMAMFESEAGQVESAGEMSWRIKFGEGSLSSLACDSAALKRFIDDLQLACGAHAAVVKLEEGSIVAHITSPFVNFRRVRAVVEAGSAPLKCGGLQATAVELGNWITIDTDTWSQLDEENADQLRDRFDEAGLGHLLTVLLATTPLHETLLVAQQEATLSAKKGSGHGQSSDFDDAEGVIVNVIKAALASGASDDEIRSKAISAGADEKAAVSIANRHLRLAQAKENWEEGQSMIEKQRASMLGKAVGEDMLCPITGEMFVDPVKTRDGMTYERVAIERWFSAGNKTSPKTNLPVDISVLIPDIQMKRQLDIDVYPFRFCAVDSDEQALDLNKLLGLELMISILQSVLPVNAKITDAVSRSDRRGKVSTEVFVQISSVKTLQELRDVLLTGELAQSLLLKAQEQLRSLRLNCDSSIALPKQPVEQIVVALSHFVEVYERSLLAMDALTPHQQVKYNECLEPGELLPVKDIHMRGPAGSGKTFVGGMHLILRVLMADVSYHVLFVAQNPGLAYFVAKWIWVRVSMKQGSRQEDMHRALSRFHVLCGETMDRGTIEVVGKLLTLKPIDRSVQKQYRLVVVDEAHDMAVGVADQIEKFVSEGVPRVLLSDISQSSSSADSSFSKRLFRYKPASAVKEVVLTQVVRCSKRIVEGARAFQRNRGDEWTSCYHDAIGPPLKTMLLPQAGTAADRVQCYASKLVQSLRFVSDTFPGLNLHNRLAIIAPSSAFIKNILPALEVSVAKEFGSGGSGGGSGSFRFVTVATANRLVSIGASTPGEQWLVLDTVDNFNGLERLFVIAVDLDLPIEGSDARKTCSQLYRAITRAQMMVIMVNEVRVGGWLEFLTCVAYDEENGFDSEQERRRSIRDSAFRCVSLALDTVDQGGKDWITSLLLRVSAEHTRVLCKYGLMILPGTRVADFKTGSAGTLIELRNHYIFCCATVEHDSGQYAGTKQDWRCGQLKPVCSSSLEHVQEKAKAGETQLSTVFISTAFISGVVMSMSQMWGGEDDTQTSQFDSLDLRIWACLIFFFFFFVLLLFPAVLVYLFGYLKIAAASFGYLQSRLTGNYSIFLPHTRKKVVEGDKRSDQNAMPMNPIIQSAVWDTSANEGTESRSMRDIVFMPLQDERHVAVDMSFGLGVAFSVAVTSTTGSTAVAGVLKFIRNAPAGQATSGKFAIARGLQAGTGLGAGIVGAGVELAAGQFEATKAHKKKFGFTTQVATAAVVGSAGGPVHAATGAGFGAFSWIFSQLVGQLVQGAWPTR